MEQTVKQSTDRGSLGQEVGTVNYRDTETQAVNFARQALGLMKTHHVIANPRNYMIWYDYCSGHNPGLARAIDALIGQGEKIDSSACDDIYNEFYCFDQEGAVIREASTRFQANLGQVLEMLSDANDGVERYGDALEMFSGKVEAGANGDDLRKLVEGMLRETHDMKEQNTVLRSQLDKSATEIDALKADLDDIRRQAMTDVLTGVANRSCFDVKLLEWAEEANESGIPLALIMADIDFFKKFNDTWGHQLGDQVLKLVANTMTDCVKGQDVVARYGGEEFAIILPNTGLKDAVTVANNVRKTVSTKNLKNRKTGEDFGKITMSFGVSVFEPGEDLENLIRRADQALYGAKRGGRNRVLSSDRDGGLSMGYLGDTDASGPKPVAAH